MRLVSELDINHNDPESLLQFSQNIEPAQLVSTYGLVYKNDIDAGHIKLDSTIAGTYGLVLTTDISAGHIKLDSTVAGTYGKVRATEISAGYIKLTTDQDLDAQGFEIKSNSTSTSITIRDDGIYGWNAGVAQFYILASDGKGYFGAGECVLSAGGLYLDNSGLGSSHLFFGSATYGRAYIYRDIGASGNLVLNNGSNYVYISKLRFPSVAAGGELRLPVKTTTGNPTATDGYIYINNYDNAVRVYADGAWRNIITW